MRYVIYFASVRNDLTASNVKLAQMKPEKFQLRGRQNVGCVYFGRIPFRGSLKGNLRASSGIVTGECALFSQVANQGKRGDFVCGMFWKEGRQMKFLRWLFGFIWDQVQKEMAKSK